MDIAAAFILVFVAFLLFPFKINEPTKINSEPPICSSIKQSSLVCIYFTCDRSSHQMPLVTRPGVILSHFWGIFVSTVFYHYQWIKGHFGHKINKTALNKIDLFCGARCPVCLIVCSWHLWPRHLMIVRRAWWPRQEVASTSCVHVTSWGWGGRYTGHLIEEDDILSGMIESLSSSATGGGFKGHLGHYAFKLDHPHNFYSKEHLNQEKRLWISK